MSGTEERPHLSGDDRRPTKTGEEASPSSTPADVQTHMAWMRTRMSIENALASWVRTATALIGFGFAIVQFSEHFDEAWALAHPVGRHLARYVGLVLIGIGSLETGIAIWEYRKIVKYLEGEGFRGVAGIPGVRRVPLASAVAVLLCLLGLLAFFTILLGV